MKNLFIAMPIHDKPAPQNEVAMVRFAYELGWEREYNLIFQTALQSSDLPRTRNLLLQKARDANADLLLWVDDDIYFKPQHFYDLVNALEPGVVDIIAGAYPKKLPGEIAVGDRTPERTERGPLFDMLVVGMGFTLLTRTAIDALLEHYGDFKYIDDDGHSITGIFEKKVEFDTIAQTNRFVGEDEMLCRKWRALGHKIWLHRYVQLGHVGLHMYQFTPDEPEAPPKP